VIRERRNAIRRQRGAAILTAMLTVVLVATLASAMLWQQWRGVEVETAQRGRVQAAWILVGALDWARLILREDARRGGADHLAEPWAVPLAPARLATFLAAQGGQSLVTDGLAGEEEVFLSGVMQDMQARLNATNLLDAGKVHEPTLAAWTRLFEHLKLPEAELDQMTQALLRASQPVLAAQVSDLRSLRPQAVSELRWLGLSASTLQALEPYITLLPERTVVNLNTAPPEVLLASVDSLDMAQAQRMVQARATRHFETLMDAGRLLGDPGIHFDANEHGIASRFFSVTGQLRLGTAVVQERSVLQRDGLLVKTLSRQRETVSPEATQVPPLQ
jgi:general secretion pathway protein K